MRSFVGAVAVGLVLSGCSVFSSTEPARLSYEGRSTVLSADPLSLEGVVTVRNVGSKTVTINVNECPLFIAAYTTPDREGDPAWASGSWNAIGCTLELRFRTLAPGDYYDFLERATLPPSLARGRYYLAMVGADGFRPVPIGQLDVF